MISIFRYHTSTNEKNTAEKVKRTLIEVRLSMSTLNIVKNTDPHFINYSERPHLDQSNIQNGKCH